MKKRTLWLSVGVLLVAVISAPLIGLFLFVNRYVQTESVDASGATRQFAAIRSRLGGVSPLIEFGDFSAPTVHRRTVSPAEPPTTVHVLAYSAPDAELRRADIPVSVMRAATLNGRLRLMNLAFLGDAANDRITLHDLEHHAPGLVVDTTTAHAAPVTVGDVGFATRGDKSRLLVWLE